MKHWTEEDVTRWLYGVQDDCTHLEHCDACRNKSEQAKAVRDRHIRTPHAVSADLLTAQRRAIYARMQQSGSGFGSTLILRLSASLALLMLVVIVSFSMLRRPAYAPLASPADARLYSDMVAIDQSSEPRAIQPIEKLFEE